jgi:cytochrome c-type biogenesis protein CcmH
MNVLFWSFAILLAALTASFVLWPLRARTRSDGDLRDQQNRAAYRAECESLDRSLAGGGIDAQAHRSLMLELDRRLLDESEPASPAPVGSGGGRGVLLALAVLLPLLAFAVYSMLGGARAEQLDGLLQQIERSEDATARGALLEEALPLLEAESRRADADGGYRFLLARVYTGQERYPEAAATYAEVAGIYPQDADILAQYAQALYMAAGRNITPAVQELIDRALTIDPAQITLLGLLGMDRFQKDDFAGAIAAWEKLLAALPADAPDASVIRDGIAAAKTRLPAGDMAAATPAKPAPQVSADEGAMAATAGPRLEVHVELSPQLQADPDTSVFVFAKAISGPPMPLAVARFQVSELPRTVVLDDSMAMAPGMRLSGFPTVKVVARVSRGGGPIAQPGDFEGEAGPVSTGAGVQQVSLRIDRKL